MKKRVVCWFVLLAFMMPGLAFPWTISDKLSAGFSSTPQPEGDSIRGYVHYRHSDRLSSRISLDNDRSKTVGDINGIEGSLLVTAESNVNTNIFLVQYDNEIGPLDYTLGVGGNIQVNRVSEKGHVVLLDQNQTFDTESREAIADRPNC